MFSSLGHECEIITCNADRIECGASIRVFERTFPARFSFSAQAASYIANTYEAHGSAVLLHGVWAGIYHQCATRCRAIGLPYIVIPHGSLDPFDLRKKAIFKRNLGPLLVRSYLDGAREVICSTSQEAELLETYGSNVSRKVLPWPVTFTARNGSDRTSARRRLGIEDDEWVVLFLSRINYKKGLKLLLAAMEKAAAAIPRLRLLVAGDGEADYVKEIRAFDRGGNCCRVDFLGFVSGSRRVDVFAAANGFALISDNENFGYAIVEALVLLCACLILFREQILEKIAYFRRNEIGFPIPVIALCVVYLSYLWFAGASRNEVRGVLILGMLLVIMSLLVGRSRLFLYAYEAIIFLEWRRLFCEKRWVAIIPLIVLVGYNALRFYYWIIAVRHGVDDRAIDWRLFMSALGL